MNGALFFVRLLREPPGEFPYPLWLKVGKNLLHYVMDFRKYATLSVASRLPNYSDHPDSE